MDVKRFFRKLDALYLAKYPDTNLRRIRRAANFTRADLARLAVALRVTAADLCERVIPNNDYADFKYGG